MMIDEAMRRAQASRSRQPGPRPGYNGSLTVFTSGLARPRLAWGLGPTAQPLTSLSHTPSHPTRTRFTHT